MKLQCLIVSLAVVAVSGMNRRDRLLRVEPGSALEQVREGAPTQKSLSSTTHKDGGAVKSSPPSFELGNSDSDVQAALEELFSDRLLQVSMSMPSSRTRNLETSHQHDKKVAQKHQQPNEESSRKEKSRVLEIDNEYILSTIVASGATTSTTYAVVTAVAISAMMISMA